MGSKKPLLVLVVLEGIVYTRHVCSKNTIALSSSWKQWPENKEKLLDAGQRTYWRTISCFFFFTFRTNSSKINVL